MNVLLTSRRPHKVSLDHQPHVKERGPAGCYPFSSIPVHISVARSPLLLSACCLPAVCQLTASTRSISRLWWAAPAALWACRCKYLQSLFMFLCWIDSRGFSQGEITSKGLLQVWNLCESLTLVVFIFSSMKDKVKHLAESKKTSKEKGKGEKKASPLCKAFQSTHAAY